MSPDSVVDHEAGGYMYSSTTGELMVKKTMQAHHDTVFIL
jgi:hypothetical protein